jgi:hypothetical protein
MNDMIKSNLPPSKCTDMRLKEATKPALSPKPHLGLSSQPQDKSSQMDVICKWESLNDSHHVTVARKRRAPRKPRRQKSIEELNDAHPSGGLTLEKLSLKPNITLNPVKKVRFVLPKKKRHKYISKLDDTRPPTRPSRHNSSGDIELAFKNTSSPPKVPSRKLSNHALAG